MKKLLINLRITIISLVGLTILFIILYDLEWSGFGKKYNKSISIEEAVNPKNGKIIKIKKETENSIPGKTLWDWLVLAGSLAIPLVILRFQSAEKERDALRAEMESKEVSENLREQALRDYFDRIANLLSHKEYRTKLLLNGDNSIREVACANTVMVLRRLKNDPERQNQVLYFLRSTKSLNFILINGNLNGANLSKLDLKEINLSKVDLNKACLANADLTNADLTEAKLFEANLSKAILSKVKFIAANLRGADLSRTELSEADFSDADLQDSNLSSANLSKVNLSGLQLNKANLSDANLTEAKLNNTNLSGAILMNANLSNADLSGANLTDTDFRGANLNGAVFTNADLLQAKLTDTKNLIPEQVKNVAKNWHEAEYDIELQNQLKLPGQPTVEQEQPIFLYVKWDIW